MKCRFEQSIALGVFFLISSTYVVCQTPASPDAGRAPNSASQSQPSGDPPEGRKAHDASYIIGNNDVLAINVWKETELSKSVPVRSDGKISLPLMGEVQAAGRTPLQLENEISEKLKSYITAPDVTVIVEQINSKKFNILGMVGKPGTFSLALPLTVMDAIAQAGGLRDFAKSKDIYVLRQKPDGSTYRIPFNYKDFIKGKNPEQNIRVEPGDTIIVP